MKKVVVAFVVVFSLVWLSACVGTAPQFLAEVSFVQQGEGWSAMSGGNFSALELTLRGVFEADAFSFSKDTLAMVRTGASQTILTLGKPSASFHQGEALFQFSGKEAPLLVDVRSIQGNEQVSPASAPFADGLSIVDTTISSGQTSTVEIHAQNLPALSGFDLFISFDPSAIDLDESVGDDFCEFVGSFSGFTPDVTVVSEGVLRISGFSLGSAITADNETVIVLHIQAEGTGGTSNVSFGEESAFLGEEGGSVTVGLHDGTVTILGDQPVLLGDFDGNDQVNIIDFGLFRQHYGYSSSDPEYDVAYDIAPSQDLFGGEWAGIMDSCEPDGTVNIFDFGTFLKNYGAQAPGGGTPPGVPPLTSPADGSSDVNTTVTLDWQASTGDTPITYTVYLGTSSNPPSVSSGISATSYTASSLSAGTEYFWKVEAQNAYGSASSPVRSFTTAQQAPQDDAYEPDDTMEQAKNLPVGQEQSRILADADWVYFDVTSGQQYTMESFDLSTGCDTYFRLYDSSGSQITYDDDDGPGYGSQIVYNPSSSGRVYLKVTQYGYSSEPREPKEGETQPRGYSSDHTYKLVLNTGALPPTPTSPDPSDGETNVELSPTLGWSMSSTTGITYDVYFGTSSNPPKVANDISAREYSPGTLSYETTYYWKVVAQNAYGTSSSAIWDFTTLPQESEDDQYEPDDDMAQAKNLPVDEEQQRILADCDWVYFDVNSGQQVSVESYDLNSGCDTYFRLYNSSGSILATNDDGGPGYGSKITYSSSSSQRLYLKITQFGYSSEPRSEGESKAQPRGYSLDHTYKLMLASGQAPSAATNPSPANGATGVSNIPTLSWSQSNSDGVTYNVYLGTSSSTVKVADGLSNTQYTPGALQAGTLFYWKVESENEYGSTFSSTWQFTTQGSSSGDDEYEEDDTFAQAKNLPAGEEQSRVLADADWVYFDVSAGESIEVESFDLNSGCDTVFRLYDSSEQQLAYNDDGGAGYGSKISYTPGSSGRLYLKITQYGYSSQRDEEPGKPVARGYSTSHTYKLLLGTSQLPSTPANPSPSNGQTGVSVDADLNWSDSTGAGDISYDVYFGTSSSPSRVAQGLSSSAYSLSTLTEGTRYYWKIVAIGVGGSTTGPLWSFTTEGGGGTSENPDFTGPTYDGEILVVSNESVNETSFANTGSISSARWNPFENRDEWDGKIPAGLEESAYRLDPHRPLPESVSRADLVQGPTGQPRYSIGDTRQFYTYNFVTGQDVLITATLQGQSAHCEVWAENPAKITTTLGGQMASEYENTIYPSVTSNFYTPSDVNSDGKVAILCYDIQDGFTGSGGYTCGYFWSGDLFNYTGSNQMEIFYIDTRPTMYWYEGETPDVDAAYGTIAHEFQHMVNFNRNYIVEGGSSMDTWLNEAFSMAAEHIVYGPGEVAGRISYYNGSSSIRDGHSLLYWDNSGDTLSNYALSYLAGQYIRTQMGQGNAIFREILEDSDNDYQCVENAIHAHISASKSFERFLTDFRLALLFKNSSGPYGFAGESAFNSISPNYYTGGAKSLRGGGALYKQISGSFTDPGNAGATIQYVGVELP
ncbi:MAG TPA: hypothetical protein P5560_09705 [Thermotogota bacterium]|nr:hypothetical protein [Thermotogota bacterium]